jgi:hypothetical protein
MSLTLINFLLEFIRIVAFPAAMVLIVAIPWRVLKYWFAVMKDQQRDYARMTELLLAVKASMDVSPTTGPALLQGLARQAEADSNIGKGPEPVTEPKGGLVVKQTVPYGIGVS